LASYLYFYTVLKLDTFATLATTAQVPLQSYCTDMVVKILTTTENHWKQWGRNIAVSRRILPSVRTEDNIEPIVATTHQQLNTFNNLQHTSNNSSKRCFIDIDAI